MATAEGAQSSSGSGGGDAMAPTHLATTPRAQQASSVAGSARAETATAAPAESAPAPSKHSDGAGAGSSDPSSGDSAHRGAVSSAVDSVDGGIDSDDDDDALVDPSVVLTEQLQYLLDDTRRRAVRGSPLRIVAAPTILCHACACRSLSRPCVSALTRLYNDRLERVTLSPGFVQAGV